MSGTMTWNSPCCAACGTHHSAGGCKGANPFVPDPLTYNQFLANAPVEDVLDLEAERAKYDLVTNEVPDEPGEDVLDLDYERTKYAK